MSSQTAGQKVNCEEGVPQGRERGDWGEGANLVIMSAAAANSTSFGKVKTEQHEITRVMKTPRPSPHGRERRGRRYSRTLKDEAPWESGEKKILLARSGHTHRDRGSQLNCGSCIAVSVSHGQMAHRRGL